MRLAKVAIRAGQSLQDLRANCEADLLRLGAEDFWYWGIGALVFAGEDTVVSVSGSNYMTAERNLRRDDIVTIDLSPRMAGLWGDYARTIIIEDGTALDDPLSTRNPQWRRGLSAELALHTRLVEVAQPSMTFEQLHTLMNDYVRHLGYENLDFLGNLGHSIELRSEDRVYIEAGNAARLDSVECFTFEPHIRRAGLEFGYKREDIYHFRDGRLVTV